MKKILGLIVVFCIFCTVQLKAEPIDLTPFLMQTVSNNGQTFRTSLTSIGILPPTAEQEFRIRTGTNEALLYGKIMGLGFVPGVDNCTIWISEKQGDNETVITTILHFNEINTGDIFAFDPVYFHNSDTDAQYNLYMTIRNGSPDNMTVWDATIIYGR